MRPAFSIIVAVYNIEKYIAKCINSILSQTCDDYEVILVDDGSSDSSGCICDRYAEAYPYKIKAIHKSNGGLSSARNVGFNKAEGEYLIFVDGDDCIAPNTIEMLGGIVVSSPDVVLEENIYCIDEDDNVMTSTLYTFSSSEYDGIPGSQALLNSIKHRTDWAAWGKAYRREYWTSHNYSFVEKRLNEDMQMIDWVVYEAGRVCMVPAFYYYRNRPGSIMQTVNAQRLSDLLQNIKERERYIEAHKDTMDHELAELLHDGHARLYYMDVMGYLFRLPSDEREALFNSAVAMKYLLGYGLNNDIRIVEFASRLLGFRLTCRLAGIIKNIGSIKVKVCARSIV